MRYRTAGATALATIALAAGSFVAGTGPTSKPAAGADLQVAASGSGSLDLWSTLPDGKSAAAGGRLDQGDDDDATEPPAYRGMLPPEWTVQEPVAAVPTAPGKARVRVEAPEAETPVVAKPSEPPEVQAQSDAPTSEVRSVTAPAGLPGDNAKSEARAAEHAGAAATADTSQDEPPKPRAQAAAPTTERAAKEDQGIFARARALVTEYLSPEPKTDGKDQQAFRAEPDSKETDDQARRRGPADFTRQFALAGGQVSGEAGKTFEASPGVKRLDDTSKDHFGADPEYSKEYNADGQVDIYGNKREVEPPRPPIELGRKQYTEGEYDESATVFGVKNPLIPGLAVYGDSRTAVAYNDNNGQELSQVATRINIDIDFKITGTERIHAFFQPLQDGAEFTRYEFAGQGADKSLNKELDWEPQSLFFEGDIGAIWAGLSNEYQDFDLPITVGLFPLFLQNGIWADDFIAGGAISIPAQNSSELGISNFDVTFFGAINDVTNPGVLNDEGKLENNNVNAYGVTAFLDALDGYWELGYGALHGYNERDGLLAHFLTAAYSRRWANTLSNSTRVFWNFTNVLGLEVGGDNNNQNVDGFAIISENSLISGLPSTLIPYANFFFGRNTPQPLVEDEGILKNVGINFETDALTGFPKLDDTGSNTWGGALGLQYLFDLDQQIVFEVAMVQPFDDPVAGAEDPQYGFGIRYQLPITRAWLIRADATYQILQNAADSKGIRFEVRRKF